MDQNIFIIMYLLIVKLRFVVYVFIYLNTNYIGVGPI